MKLGEAKAIMITPPQPGDPRLMPGILMAVHIMRSTADSIDRQQCGPRIWHHRLCGNLSPWALRKAANWLEQHVK